MKKYLLKITLSVVVSLFGIAAIGQTYTFTNSGATGKNGPTQGQVTAAYTATTLAGAVTITTQGIQGWTVPTTGSYSITGSGASGGNAPGNGQTRIGGLGATMYGEFSLISGDVVAIIIGQTGVDCTPVGTNYMGGGGGGGTFVTVNGTIVMAVAGGGGAGLGEDGNFGANGTAGLTGTTGNIVDLGIGTGTRISGSPGSGGSGGTGGNYYGASGGAGWLTNGANASGTGSNSTAGLTFTNTGNGGNGGTWSNVAGGVGGFGGGGGGSFAGGGGGGYSGGPGGTHGANFHASSGGGAGSLNTGVNQTNITGANSGMGSVIITSLCAAAVAPTFTTGCPSNITTNNTAGACGAVVNYITPIATDNCGNHSATLTSGLASGATFPIGTTTNTYSFTNGIGTTTCSFTVTVTDTESPVITCPANITVNNGAGQCGALVNYPAPVGTDNCPGVTTALTAGPASGSTFPIGTTTITYTANDAAGNASTSCSFTITVVDAEAPVIFCPSNITVVNGAGQCGAVINYAVPNGTDNCPGVTTALTAGLTSGSTFPTGVTTVTYTATDAVGNTTSCSFTVTVIENQAPTITCPTNITVNNGVGLCGAVVNYVAPIGTDNCPGVTTALTAGFASGSTFPLGTTLVSYTVTDAAGNTAICSFTVTVTDVEAPTITCPSNITVNNGTGQCSAVVNYSIPTGADNCPGVTVALTSGPASGSTFPLGTTTVTYTATDAVGNTSVPCSFTVTIIDVESPTIICPANITVSNGAGQCDAVVNYTIPTGADNCPGVTTALTSGPSSGSIFSLGTTTVTYTATDAAGNTSVPCSFTVTVVETETPVLVCPANITVNNTLGQCNAVVTYTAPIGTDNCPGVSTALTAGPTSGSTFPLGSTTVTYTASDVSGNTTSCSFTVTVVDAEIPTITCPANITVNNSVGQCSAVVNYTIPTGADNCSGVTVALVSGPASGSTFLLGATVVTYTATDAVGNTSAPCSFIVTVVDAEAPVIVCPVNISVNNDAGLCGAVVTYTAPVGTDNCPGVTTALTAGLVSGSTFPSGATVVTYTATDAAGNSTPCSFTVTVVDTEAPVIVCPANITVSNAVGQCDSMVTYTAPVGTDNCPGVTVTLTSGLASGSVFPTGTSTITYIATDAAGNTSAPCSFIVTVVETEIPVIVCPANITVNNDTGVCDAVVIYTPPVGTDNCPGVTTVLTSGLASGSTFPLGVNTVTYTVTDAVGNTDSCSFTITVVDAESPVIACPADIAVNIDPGQCDAIVNYTIPTGTDNCSSPTIVIVSGPVSGSGFSIGITTVTFTATDVAGNIDTCSFTITVVDTIAPSIICRLDTSSCDSIVNGIAPIGTSDNCIGEYVTFTLSGATTGSGITDASGSAFNVGITNVWYHVTDSAGNTNSCTFKVEIYPLPIILLNSFDTDTLCLSDNPIALPFASPVGGTYSGTGVVDSTFNPALAGTGTHYIYYSFADSNTCVNTDSVMIVVDLCTGIDEAPSLNEIKIYPNPTNALVHVNLGNHNGSINYTISTIEGRIVNQEQNVSSNKITIDLSDESKGIYLLRIKDNISSKVYKIIKE